MPTHRALLYSIPLLICSCTQEHTLTTAARTSNRAQAASLGNTDAARFGYNEAAPTSRPSADDSFTDLRWQLPSGWTTKGPASMRVESFAIAGQADLDCYISQLGSGAGGLRLNVNRWRSQLGLSDITQAQAQLLPQVHCLGTKAILVELQSPDTERCMLVVAAFLADRSVFVKMLGPTDSVRTEKPRFVAFCKTLKVQR